MEPGFYLSQILKGVFTSRWYLPAVSDSTSVEQYDLIKLNYDFAGSRLGQSVIAHCSCKLWNYLLEKAIFLAKLWMFIRPKHKNQITVLTHRNLDSIVYELYLSKFDFLAFSAI